MSEESGGISERDVEEERSPQMRESWIMPRGKTREEEAKRPAGRNWELVNKLREN